MAAGIHAMEAGMKKSLGIRIATLLLASAPLAQAAEGLVVPSAETLWPRWQARIAVQAASVSPLATSNLFDAGHAAQRGVRGGALFGDYYFAMPSFGSFRASGGVVSGSLAGLPLANAGTGTRLGLSVNGSSLPLGAFGNEPVTASPYLGLGFTSAALWRSGLSISADIGLVAEHLATPGVGRAVFGNQAMERELRLSPLLQLGVRYAF